MAKVIKNSLGNFLLTVLIFLIVTGWIFSGWPQIFNFPLKIQEAQASEYLTNPSFTGGVTGWTLVYTKQDDDSIIEYDSSYYQDTSGSTKGRAVDLDGKRAVLKGYYWQTIGTSIGSSDTIKLTAYWSKRSIVVDAITNNIQIDIAKPSAPDTWITIWEDTSIPSADGATSWTGSSELDVSSYFDETGTYKFRIYWNMKSGTTNGAEALAWFDNLSLDVTAAAASSLSFSISDNSIGFGTLSTSAATWATGDETGSASEVSAHTLTASTNAANGYIITVNGTTLTSGGDTITAIGASATDVTSGAGTEQFGIRLTASGGNGSATFPYNGVSNNYALDTAAFPDEVASDSDGDDVTTTFSVFYAANIAVNTEVHTDYTSTLTYIATGNF